MDETVNQVVDLSRTLSGFAMKLHALLHSPYEHTLYMDCDTTVHAAALIRVLKAYVSHFELTFVHDWPWRTRYVAPIPMFNSGLLGYHAHHPLVQQLLRNAQRKLESGDLRECDAAFRLVVQRFVGDRLPAPVFKDAAADRTIRPNTTFAACRHSDQEAMWSELARGEEYSSLRSTFLPTEFHCAKVRPDRATYDGYYDCLLTHYHGSGWPCSPACHGDAIIAEQMRHAFLRVISRLRANGTHPYCDGGGLPVVGRYPRCSQQPKDASHLSPSTVAGKRDSDSPGVVAVVQRCGLGNRLTMLGRGFAFARAKNVSSLAVYWVPDVRWPASFSALFNAQAQPAATKDVRAPTLAVFDVDLAGPKARWAPKTQRLQRDSYHPVDEARWPVLARMGTAAAMCDDLDPHTPCTVSGCNAAIRTPVIAALNQNPKLKHHFERGCLSMLRTVRPVAWVQHVVSAHLPREAIGIHIRGQDWLTSGSQQGSVGRRLSQMYSECSPPEAMAEAALRLEGTKPVVAFVAAGSESLAARFHAAVRRRGGSSWRLLTGMDLLRLAGQTVRLPNATLGVGEESRVPEEIDFLREELFALLDMWALASTTRLYRPPMTTLSRVSAVWKQQRPAVVDVFDSRQPGCALNETLNRPDRVSWQGGMCEEAAAHVVRCHAAFDNICDPRSTL